MPLKVYLHPAPQHVPAIQAALSSVIECLEKERPAEELAAALKQWCQASHAAAITNHIRFALAGWGTAEERWAVSLLQIGADPMLLISVGDPAILILAKAAELRGWLRAASRPPLKQISDRLREYRDSFATPKQETARMVAESMAKEARSKPRKRRRQGSGRKQHPLTPRQLEAVQMVAEHKGNMTAAGKAMGASRQAVKDLYEKALAKVGQSGIDRMTVKSLPTDRRGQVATHDPNGPRLPATPRNPLK